MTFTRPELLKISRALRYDRYASPETVTVVKKINSKLAQADAIARAKRKR